jgi:hypothetical protein
MEQEKESYIRPEVIWHELLRDITAGQSRYNCNEKQLR